MLYIVFATGLVIGGFVGVLLMSMMFVAKRSDEEMEKFQDSVLR